jgi:hypothetical protein
MSSHPADLLTEITCLEHVEALLDYVQLYQLEVALLFVLRCRLVESTIISIFIITNASTVITELPQSDPGGPCEGDTRPGSDATSSPVALWCREKVSWLHSNTAARERRLTKVLSAH